jgi:hypothetical protein
MRDCRNSELFNDQLNGTSGRQPGTHHVSAKSTDCRVSYWCVRDSFLIRITRYQERHMKYAREFLSNALVGGVLIPLPVYFAVLVLLKGI